MSSRSLLLAAPALLGLVVSTAPALAFGEGEIIRMHEACIAGDRAACARREGAIHDRDHEVEWRRSHPEWYR